MHAAWWNLPARFTFVRFLAQFGHGKVALVTDNDSGRECVVKKTLRGKRIKDTEIEFGTVAGREGFGPNIVFVNKDRTLLVMEKLHETLFQYRVRTGRKLKDDLMDTVFELFKSCAENGFDHNDPMVHNIMRNQDGRWFLIDFGESRDLSKEERKNPESVALQNMLALSRKGSTDTSTGKVYTFKEIAEWLERVKGYVSPAEQKRRERIAAAVSRIKNK